MNSSVELELTISANKTLPESWDYDRSVTKVKSLVTSFKTVSSDMLHELWVAREKLNSQGTRTDLTSGQLSQGWDKYCFDVGIIKRTANRWLEQYDPVEKKKIEKPTPTPEQIKAKAEWKEKVSMWEKEDNPKPSNMNYDDLIAEADLHLQNAEERKEFSMNNETETLAQDNVMNHIDRYLNAFEDKSRRLEAVQNLIKRLRRIATQLHSDSLL
jgi:hypothetical protein